MTYKLDIGAGLFALVDDSDFHSVADFSWHARRLGQKVYAITKQRRAGKVEVIYLHRLIAGVDNERISFANKNSLDCRRENLVVSGMLSRKTSYHRGALGEAMVIADLTAHGHDVFIPVSGHTPADLVSIDQNGTPIRWQVKLRSLPRRSTTLTISLKAIQPLKGGYLRKPYDLTLIDGFAVYCPDIQAVYYVPVSEIDTSHGSFSISVSERRFLKPQKFQTPHIK